MKKSTPLAALAALAVVAASVVVASPASAVSASYANPLASASTSDRDITSLDVDYSDSTLSVTAHTQNMPPAFIFSVYFAQNPGSFSSGAMEMAQVSVQGTTTTHLATYANDTQVAEGDGSLVSWNRTGDDFTITVPSSVIPWSGDVYASAEMILTDTLDFRDAATAIDAQGGLTGFGPIHKGQVGTSTSVALSAKSQKHSRGGVTFFATVAPAGTPGSVVFYDGSTPIGSADAGGGAAAIPSPTSLAIGKHRIHATFFPADPNYAVSQSSSVPFTVHSIGKTTTTKVSASSSIQHYKKTSVRISVKLSSTKAKGTVVLYQGSKKLTSATLKKGRAHLTVRKSLTKGTHKLTVKYLPSNVDAYKTSRSRVLTVRVVR